MYSPRASGRSKTLGTFSLTPLTVTNVSRRPTLTFSPEATETATRRSSPTTRPSRSTSSRVSRLIVGAEPSSNLPGTTMMMFEPRPSTCCSTSCLAPAPSATRTTTAATPMTTPSMVRALRSLLATQRAQRDPERLAGLIRGPRGA